ncbi:LCP family protein [Adlercreutzia sp. ZJ242]|uniref:LCP family protein n=1 Tax=Adlercreutzia sp. ZJ242 TaxID=2709409 RepID=UPI0013EAC684|nr:LCP family protein [Adlercreutzia sp. ZJ242]
MENVRRTGRLVRGALIVASAALLALALCGCSGQKEQQSSSDARVSLEVSDHAEETVDPYVLVIGDDSWESYTPGRSDLMALLKLDPANKQMYLISVPRDTAYVTADGSVIKANMAYERDGVEGALAAVKDITGVDVKQYAIIGFDQLQSIVGYFGELPIDLPYPLDYSFYTNDYPNEVFEAGEQTLTPWRAMALSRARTSYSDFDLDNDMMRQVVDRQMFVRLMAAVYESEGGSEKALSDLYQNVTTNIPLGGVLKVAAEYASMDSFTVYGTSGPTFGGIDPDTELWLIPNEPDKWRALMDVVESGGDPATVDVQPEGSVQSDIAPINAKYEVTPA